jgi:hypothetical protein
VEAMTQTEPRAREVRQIAGRAKRQQDELAKKYAWKAETILRFFKVFKMDADQQAKFLAKELASAYMCGEYNAIRKAAGGERE